MGKQFDTKVAKCVIELIDADTEYVLREPYYRRKRKHISIYMSKNGNIYNVHLRI